MYSVNVQFVHGFCYKINYSIIRLDGMSLKIYKGLREIASSYECFLIDLWGVVHNGQELLPGVANCIYQLQQARKKIVFLTNSPRPGNILEKLLDDMGLLLEQGNMVYSSGDACIEVLKEKWNGKTCFFLGDAGLHDCLRQEIPGSLTDTLDSADYILLSGLPGATSYVLSEGLLRGLPLICANPDKSAIHGTTKVACPGSVAEEYESKGGKVYYIGKPHTPIYIQALHHLGNPNTEKVLAIGDGLFTDILGATRMGLDVVFIQSGLHQELPADHFQKTLKTHKLRPTYILERLNW